ncbi:MAG: SAM-dependent MidA family methyltransferase [Gammaproteobacteria bacterium]|jgi:SAM-dependent MidA family methyltransferase
MQLPEPDSDSIQQSQVLIEHLTRIIEENGGVISFQQYMETVLYAPALGYYSAGRTKFGAAGDFVTSPEISDLFGKTLAVQLKSLFDQGCNTSILEFGAGSGELCRQILSQFDCPLEYFILEISADLRGRQQNYLARELSSDQFERVHWLDRLPEKFNGVVLANELLDAMPVALLEKQTEWTEVGVGYKDGKLYWRNIDIHGPAIDAMFEIESRLGSFESGYRTEFNLNYQPWFNSLYKSCNQAVILLIDYGYEQPEYYHPNRSQGTLICHFQHHAHADPLVYPGLQDITAFVDFDAVADAAEAAGFETLGLTSQHRFLLQNGLLDLAAIHSAEADITTTIRISQEIKTLTLPEEMGDKFKVVAFHKNSRIHMPAFDQLR